MRKTNLFPFLSVLLLAALPGSACTIWSAAGERVSGGGTLIAKNRDNHPDKAQFLKLVKPDKGYSYLGLYGAREGYTILAAGINDQGLTITNATAGNVPEGRKDKEPVVDALHEILLRTCKTVDEALSHPELMSGSRFLMLSDRKQIAVVEIAPDGDLAIERRRDGVLYHTNHYLMDELQKQAREPKGSSPARYKRISELIQGAKAPMTVENFQAFSSDKNDGPDNSIWRSGSKPTSVRTLSSWIVETPAEGSPVLYLKAWDDGSPEKCWQIKMDDVFSGACPVPYGRAQ